MAALKTKPMLEWEIHPAVRSCWSPLIVPRSENSDGGRCNNPERAASSRMKVILSEVKWGHTDPSSDPTRVLDRWKRITVGWAADGSRRLKRNGNVSLMSWIMASCFKTFHWGEMRSELLLNNLRQCSIILEKALTCYNYKLCMLTTQFLVFKMAAVLKPFKSVTVIKCSSFSRLEWTLCHIFNFSHPIDATST